MFMAYANVPAFIRKKRASAIHHGTPGFTWQNARANAACGRLQDELVE